MRVQRWFSSSPPGPAATSDGGHAAGEPRFTVERYRSVTLEPRRRSGDAASPAPSTAEEHLAAMAGQEPDAVIAGILNGVASASTDQSMVKCVDADPNAACVADPAILCPEYLRAMADAAASKAVGPRGDDKVAASCLMLGGGAGCLAHHMLDRSRGSEAGAIARFVSVDAEPRMISAGQTLLGVTDGALETRCADALKYAREHPHEQGSFDAVFVDLFVGAEVPKVFRGAAFIADLKRLAKPHGGTVIANLPAADADYKLACEAAFGQGAVTETRVTRGSNVIVTCTRGD
uniref:Methyltransferase type 11 domain-containing protein n=1 Tax=Neobodo designis TaxID=312471 RepID=A0A7S1QTD4_NEODS